jgi:hypothetical protein
MLNTIIYTVALSVILESITIFCRFVLKLESAPIQKKLYMPRIHHGYVGTLMLVILFFYPHLPYHYELIVIANSLILSDLLHHFVALPLLVKKQ